jgi:hypothetical protein
VLWKSIENSTTPEDFRTYLAAYPHGAFAPLAQRHLDEFEQQAEAEQAAAERANEARIAEERKNGIWADPASELMWTKKDYGPYLTWPEAVNLCKSLQLAGYADWRLPSINDLRGIFDKTVPKVHAKGGLDLSHNDYSTEEWSSDRGQNRISKNTTETQAWVGFFNGKTFTAALWPFVSRAKYPALYVRDLGKQ